MSTKTTFKRVALVAVAALGFGVLTSVAPAIAAAPTPGVFTPTNTVTTLAGRIGQQVSVPLVGDLAIQAAGTTSAVAYLRVAAAMTSAPAAAASTYVSITAVTSAFATDGTAARLIYVGSHVTAAGTTAIATATTHAQDATRPATINYGTTATDAETDWNATTGTSLGTLTFTPTAAGTYTFTVWNESSVQTSAAVLSGTEASQTFTVNVGASVASVTLAAVNSSAAIIGATLTAGGSDGSLVKVSLKDAAGLASTLTSGESVSIQPSLSGKVAKVNGGATTGATAGGAYVLSSADFGTRGFAYVNITDTVAETVTLTATTGSASSATVNLTFRTIAAASGADASEAPYAATRSKYVITSTSVTAIPVGAVTTTWVIDGTATPVAATTANYATLKVTDTLGAITGWDAGAAGFTDLAYDAVASVGLVGATTAGLAFIGVTATTVAASEAYRVANNFGTNGAVGTANVVSSVANGTGPVTVSVAAVNATLGATTTIKATIVDKFNDAMPNQTLTMTVAGRNANALGVVKISDANGMATFTLTDAATSGSDVVTISGGTGSTANVATIVYLANAKPSTLTVTTPDSASTIAGTVTSPIDATKAGADNTTATVSVVVKNSDGALLTGVPVTVAVSGNTGAGVYNDGLGTDYATVYTDASGKATSYIWSHLAGKATVTFTSGAVTATGDVYFAQEATSTARTITASVAGNIVKATVKDRYGNAVKGAAVDATRTGTGYFGNGSSSVAGGLTDKNGEIEFIVNGSAVVTVAFNTTTYGQSASAAGYVGTTIVTATGKGATLAPAGINSATATVTAVVDTASLDAATAAADAAAEATDAANAATDAANAAAEAADAATAAAQDAADAVAALSTQVSEMIDALKKQITALTNLVIKIQKKVKA